MLSLTAADFKKSVYIMHEKFFFLEFCNPKLGMRVIHK